jgi:hypothetical protein
MSTMELTNEDKEKIEKLVSILNRGWYANSKEVTDLYNKYIRSGQTPVASTSCSSCIRQRVLKLKTFLTETIKKEEEKKKKEE